MIHKILFRANLLRSKSGKKSKNKVFLWSISKNTFFLVLRNSGFWAKIKYLVFEILFFRFRCSFFSRSSENTPYFKGNHRKKVFCLRKYFFSSKFKKLYFFSFFLVLRNSGSWAKTKYFVFEILFCSNTFFLFWVFVASKKKEKYFLKHAVRYYYQYSSMALLARIMNTWNPCASFGGFRLLHLMVIIL